MNTPATASSVCAAVAAERARQDAKWGQRNHAGGTGPDGTLMGQPFSAYRDGMRSVVDDLHRHGQSAWLPILLRGVFEAASETDLDRLRAELVKVAAISLAWIEAIDQRPAAELVNVPAGLAELLTAVAEQLPQDDPETCAETLTDMNHRAAEQQPACGDTIDLAETFGVSDGAIATCTKQPHLPADPWHQDRNRNGVRWSLSDAPSADSDAGQDGAQ